MLRRAFCALKKQIMSLLSQRLLCRDLAPESEILSCARPKKVSKERAVRLPITPVLLAALGIHAYPLRANPNKISCASRGKPE